MNDIVNIKLVTGEDMFAELLDHSEIGIIVKNPLITTEIQGPDGNPMMGLYPYLVHSDTDICVLNNNLVITVTKTSPIVESFYHNSNYFSDQLISDQMERIKQANIYINESIQLDSLDEQEFLVDLNNISFLVH